MTDTHTPWQRGRRAGERGVPRDIPHDLTGSCATEWLAGYDSCFGARADDICCGHNDFCEHDPINSTSHDPINHPSHYTSHPSGIECIQITEHMDFLTGNAMKYLWRAGLKTKDRTEDLEKAAWYIQRAIEKGE